MNQKYEIKTEVGKYGSKWVVFRIADQKVMTEGHLQHCLRWVRSWGDTDLGR